jgi:glycyl-tRNA synthetase beta chain
MAQRLLFELLCEEIPVNEQIRFQKEAAQILEKLLIRDRVKFGKISVETTPRRLVVCCEDVVENQENLEEEISGPPSAIAFKDGNPTKAALGFAKKVGMEISELHRIEKKGKEYLAAWKKEEGVSSKDILKTTLKDFINKIPFSKSMRWGDNDYTFSRPLRGILALLGSEIIEVKSHGKTSSNYTYGHRFRSIGKVRILNSNDYETILLKNHVVVKVENRKRLIKEEIVNIIQTENIEIIDDEKLLEEVALLVESPTVVLGSFSEEFLVVPEDVILSAMRKHQRYFSFTKDGKLAPKFLTVLGTKIDDPVVALNGNERVLSARLSDARFFWDEDRKSKLEIHKKHLENMVYHKKLGTIWDKVNRIIFMGEYFCGIIGGNVDFVKRGGVLCKMDLETLMVGEFPELQGVMGYEYAKAQGEPDEVAKSIFEHYLPKFSGDKLPLTKTGTALALADRMDTISGGIGAGLKPTGSADPFAIRRAALGFLRIILDKNIQISLNAVIEKSLINVPCEGNSAEIKSFIVDRLRTLYGEFAPKEVVEGILACGDDNPVEGLSKLKAIMEISETDDFRSLVRLYKRMNILKKVEKIPVEINENLLKEKSEKNLFNSLIQTEESVNVFINNKDYVSALKNMIPLWKVVDDFFDDKIGVRVMDDDPKLKNNRVALLGKLDRIFKNIADFTLLAGLL